MIRTDVPVPYQDVRARLFAAVVDFEPPGRRVVELVAHPHKSKSDQCYVATSCGSEKRRRVRQRSSLGENTINTRFSLQDFPSKHHHGAWLGGYAYMQWPHRRSGRNSRRAIHVPHGVDTDYLTRRASRSTGGVERVGRSIYDKFCVIPRDMAVAGDRREVGEKV